MSSAKDRERAQRARSRASRGKAIVERSHPALATQATRGEIETRALLGSREAQAQLAREDAIRSRLRAATDPEIIRALGVAARPNDGTVPVPFRGCTIPEEGIDDLAVATSVRGHSIVADYTSARSTVAAREHDAARAASVARQAAGDVRRIADDHMSALLPRALAGEDIPDGEKAAYVASLERLATLTAAGLEAPSYGVSGIKRGGAALERGMRNPPVRGNPDPTGRVRAEARETAGFVRDTLTRMAREDSDE